MIRKPEPHAYAPYCVPLLARTPPDAIDGLRTGSAATLALFQTFEQVVQERMGQASGQPLSVRAAVHVIAGHERHHLAVLHERHDVA